MEVLESWNLSPVMVVTRDQGRKVLEVVEFLDYDGTISAGGNIRVLDIWTYSDRSGIVCVLCICGGHNM